MAMLIIALLIGVLVLLYMARPRYERREVSSAAFFGDLPEARQTRFKWRWANPLLRRRFYLQLASLILALVTLWISQHQWQRSQAISEVLIVIDTSASMSTAQADGTRLQHAKDRARELVDLIEDAAASNQPQVALAAFDLETRQISQATSATAFTSALNNLEPRPLGTDLAQLNAWLERNKDNYSHSFVISDKPPPAWADRSDQPLHWLNIGEPANNTGFESIQAMRDPLTGAIERIQFTVRNHGSPQPTRIQITDQSGASLYQRNPTWRDGVFRDFFIPPPSQQPNQYTFSVSEGGAYAWDDRVDMVITQQAAFNLDWRIQAPQLQGLTSSQDPTQAPRVIITDTWQPDASVPQLVIGPGFQGGDGEIRDFVNHPILQDLNLDVAERLVPLNADLSAKWLPLLRTTSGNTWVAQCESPPSIYIAGLPQLDTSDEGKFTTTLFFNSLRWLLERSPTPPLYQLTHPQQLEVQTGVTALHLNEGDTLAVVAPAPLPDIEELGATSKRDVPIWPPFACLTLALICLERILAVWGGRKWQ